MSQKSREILKSYFETGDYPTEAQFAALIDSLVHKDDFIAQGKVTGLADTFTTLNARITAINALLNSQYFTRAQVLQMFNQSATPVKFVDSLPAASSATMGSIYIITSANDFTANVVRRTPLPNESESLQAEDIIGDWDYDDWTEGEVEVGDYCLDDDFGPGCIMECTAINSGIPVWEFYEELPNGATVWTRDGYCYRNEGTWERVADPYTYAWVASHTPAQVAAIDWAVQKRAAELQDTALTAFRNGCATAVTGQGFTADTATSTTMTVTVTTKWAGALVDCDATPSGWTRTSTGTYQRTVTGASGTVASATFTYTISGGTYDGLTVTYASTAKSIAVTYPAWYGFSTAADFASLDLSTLTRVTAKPPTASSLTNAKGNGCYLWLVTHSTATATEMNLNILSTIASGQSFTSPSNAGITLSGYRIYRSNLTYDLGSFGINMTLNV